MDNDYGRFERDKMKENDPRAVKMPDYFAVACLCRSCEKRKKRAGQIVCDYCHKNMNDPHFYDK